jgi:phospholipid/cholesterol/gamma-HCH transport system permease protein
MRVLGINPIHRLVVPRVLASTVVALLLNGLVCTIGILGGFLFSVYVQDVNPGAFVNGITLLTGFGELMISMLKAGLFGMIAGLMAAYLGMNVRGGAKSVGDAVNQTVVFSFMALFVVNVLVTAVGIKLTSG